MAECSNLHSHDTGSHRSPSEIPRHSIDSPL
jgi:hypothetical protein